MSNDRKILEQTLGRLLGFDDGASDVLEHLLTIESRDDLLEYLMQLLGQGATPEISEFVDNVGNYNLKEPLTSSFEHEGSSAISATGSDSNATPTAAPPALKQSLIPVPPSRLPKQAAVESRRNQAKQNKSRVPPPKTKQQGNLLPTQEKTNVTGNKKGPTESSSNNNDKQDSIPKKVEKLRPSRGEAKTTCGCFGTFHKPLTNCLYCGRISCVEEGYDFCPFCGYMVDDVSDGQDHSQDPSWQQKERLLRFDREFARRTEVFDDQADFQGPSTWMSADERAQAEENKQNQLESLKRPKQVLNLAL